MHDIDLGLEVVLDGPNPTLWDAATMRETLRFLRKRGKDISPEKLAILVAAILRGPQLVKRSKDEEDETLRKRRDFQIRLYLRKLVESGAQLPAEAAAVYERIEHELPWEPRCDGSEEFPFFLSSGWVNDEPGPLAKFNEMSISQFIDWSKAQKGERWETHGGWDLFLEESPKEAVRFLAEASRMSEWPVSPWYVALNRVEQAKNVPSKTKKEIANLLTHMPLETRSQVALPASRWLEKTRNSLPKRLRQKLWRKIWDASLLEEALDAPLNFDLTLNHSGGVLGSTLYDELSSYIPRVSSDDQPGLPQQLRADFEKVGSGESASAKLARVRISPMLVFLYRIDAEWTRLSLLSRMDPDLDAFDPYLWEGYLWSPRFSDDLLAEFKEAFYKVLARLDLIPERVQRHAAQLFVQIAIPPDRRVTTAEAHSVLFNLEADQLADAAWALKDIVSAAGDKSLVLWRSTIGPWFRAVWPKRRVDKSKTHSGNLVWLAIDSDEAFPEILASIKDLILEEEWEHSLYHLRRKQEENRIVSRFPEASLELADKLVGETTRTVGGTLGSVLDEIVKGAPRLRQDSRFQRLWLKAN